MTSLLLRIFVPDYRNREDTAVRSAIGSMSGAVGICCNLLLCVVKLVIGALAGSVSVTADALNNLSDASGSVVTLLGFRMAGKPADEHHPYGHARAEYLSGLAVAVMVLFIGLELGKSAVTKILRPSSVDMTALGFGLLLLSVGVKLWLSRFNRQLGEQTGSTALRAASVDCRNDCIATSVVLLSALLERVLDVRVDGIFGLGVAVFILRSGWQLAAETVSPLLGENADPELREKIVDYIRSRPEVLGYHDLMVHDYGPGQRYASLHVEMDHRQDPLDCHEWIDDMERECLRSHNVHLVIHYDPVIVEDPERSRLMEAAQALLKARDERLTLHDFRMIQGRKHMNLVFDVPLPSDLRGREEQLRRDVEEKLNELGPLVYHVKITYDNTAFTP